MLCMQQCIDMCELTAEEELSVQENANLQDILSLLSARLRTNSIQSIVSADADRLTCGTSFKRD